MRASWPCFCSWLDKNVIRDYLFIKFSWPTSRAKQREATECRSLGRKSTKIQRKCERTRHFRQNWQAFSHPRPLFRWKAASSSRRPKLASVYKEHMLSIDYWIAFQRRNIASFSCFLYHLGRRLCFAFFFLFFFITETPENAAERKILLMPSNKLSQFFLQKPYSCYES